MIILIWGLTETIILITYAMHNRWSYFWREDYSYAYFVEIGIYVLVLEQNKNGKSTRILSDE